MSALKRRVDALEDQFDRIVDLLIPTLDDDLAEEARALKAKR